MTHTTSKGKAAGGFETTTATINNSKRTLALFARIKGLFVRFASWLAVIFRGFV